jgi:transaldolase
MKGADEVYIALAVADVRDACDLLLPVYEATRGADGLVSLEVSPHLAYDPVATVGQARSLWNAVARPNLLIKVPGTDSGLHAVELLLSDGINVNVTLLFGIRAYQETIQAHLRGLERRLRDGRELGSIASVASFFLSRIDVAVDRELRQRIHPEVDERIRRDAEALLGKVAVANARLAYGLLRETLQSERWRLLEREGARPQRLVWASTGTKDPTYSDSDVMYVEPLIGPFTVSTMPESTADAFHEHGVAAATLTPDTGAAAEVMGRLEHRLGMYSIKPLDVETLQRAARETVTLLVIEDHNRDGGLGEAVAAQVGRLARVFRLGVSGEPHSATPEQLLERHRLSSTAIEREALAVAA